MKLKCSDEEISLLLSDYFTGHLSPDEETQVESHLNECRACRVALRTMILIAGRERISRQVADDRHYSPALLSRYYSAPRSLDPRLIEQIESHLASCSQCAEDISFLRNSDIDLRAVVQAERDRRSHRGFLARLKKILTGRS